MSDNKHKSSEELIAEYNLCKAVTQYKFTREQIEPRTHWCEDVIRHLPYYKENYEKAVKKLKSRFFKLFTV